MYGHLWRALPGSRPVKALLCLVLVFLVIAVCFVWLFPAIAQILPFNGNAVQSGLPFPGSTTSAM